MTAKSRYDALKVERERYVTRSREIAGLTIPSQFIGDSETNMGKHKDRGELPDPYQSVGARGVRNLSSKFMLSLLPPNTPFFKYSLNDNVMSEIIASSGGKLGRGDIEQSTARLTRTIQSLFEQTNIRVEGSEIFTSLIIDGNPLIYLGKDLKFNVYRLDSFVIQRDRSGKIIEIIVKESFVYRSLEDFVKVYVDKNMTDKDGDISDEPIDVYTHVTLGENGRYNSYQEICGNKVTESITEYPKGKLPWIAPRVVKIAGENYGRPYAEEFIGDLRSLEGLSKALVEMAAASSKIVFLVNPTSTTTIRDLKKARNGDFVMGNPNDVNPLQAKLNGDFAVVNQQASTIEARLQQAFLLVSSIQRDAERVTAEEIRLMATELDNALGGLYSILSSEFQKPLIDTFQWRLQSTNILRVPDELEANIITGIDALGRGQDINRLNGFINNILSLSQAIPSLSSFINGTELINRIAAAHGIDEFKLIKTPEEVAAEQQQAQMQEQLMNGPLGKSLGEMAVNQTDPANQPPEQQV